jgi:hypothetical protein
MRSNWQSILCVLFFATIIMYVNADAPTWKLCPGAPITMKVNNMTVTYVNSVMSAVIEANVNEQVSTGAQVTLGVNYNGGPIFSENLDMSVGTKLPVNGDFTWKYQVLIPSFAPSGSYSVDLTFMDQNKVPITCVEVDMTLGAKSKHRHIRHLIKSN